MCSQECRENLMKFSKGRSAACVTGKEVRRRERPSQWSERWLTILERSCCWRRLLEKPRSSGYVRVRLVRIDMFSSSTAARRPTEVSITVTLVVRTLKFGRIFPEKEASEEDSYRFSKTEIQR